MKKLFHLTEAGVHELRTELERLLAERGPIAERIKAARAFGDQSENAEYSSARQEQDRVESRIAQIEQILQNVKLIPKPQKGSKVQLGSMVKLRCDDGRSKQFHVVGTVEADPLSGKISDESPVGQNLLGKIEGDEIELRLPGEVVTYTIIEVA